MNHRRAVGTVSVENPRDFDSERIFARIFNAASNAMAFTEPVEGRIVDVNESWLRASGLTRAQAIGKTALELGLWVTEAERDACRAALEKDRRLIDFETRLHFHSSIRSILLSAEVIEMQHGPHVLWEFKDITARRLAEVEQEKLREQLEQAHKIESIGTLAGGLAHDFNNILGSIMLQLEMLVIDHDLTDDVTQVIRDVRGSADRAARLTQQLLTFSRKRLMHMRTCDLNVVVSDRVRKLLGTMDDTITVALELSPRPVRVEGDEAMIEQVVMNLCLNARDAMPKGGRLRITTDLVEIDEDAVRRDANARIGRFARLLISDNGIGMDEETRRRAFEPFFTTKEVGQGSGLGLSTAHGIVAQHHGWIDVESALYQGSTFAVYFPASELAASDAVPTATLAPRNDCATVLLVEDEDVIRRLTRRALREIGCRVIEANTGVAALQAWASEEGRIDLLVTDMNMPGGLSGMALSEQLRQQKPELKVLIMSGYSAELVRDGGVFPDNTSFLGKPFSLAEFGDAIKSMLDLTP